MFIDNFIPKFKIRRFNLNVFLTAKYLLPFIEFWKRETLLSTLQQFQPTTVAVGKMNVIL